MINKVYNWILDVLFTEKCLGCKRKGFIMCDTCIAQIRPAERETRKDIVACYDYRDPFIKNAIWSLKYRHNRYVGEILGKLLYECMMEEVGNIRSISQGSPIVVIPIPISRDKERIRGYNQTETIAESFCKNKNTQNNIQENIFELRKDWITKKINTTPQARITNRTLRIRNVHNAFEIKNSVKAKGRNIIVIDDVTTTGATMTEVIKILKRSGARSVVGFAIAH